MSWTPKTEQSETWTEKTKQAEAWIQAGTQGEVWTGHSPAPRVFDPFVFDRFPVFDTGSSLAGVWDDKVQQPEVWA